MASPVAGATSLTGIFRFRGALLGAFGSVFFVPLFVQAPILFSLVVAILTGCLLYIYMLDRSAHSYLFMLGVIQLP